MKKSSGVNDRQIYYFFLRFGIAPGYRGASSGSAVSVGSSGYIWSPATNDDNGVNLSIHTTGLSPSYANYRAYGFQLRCLSE